MIIDEKFVFYVIGLFCGFVLFEIFRVVEMFRSRRRGQLVRKDTGEGYRKFVDNYKRMNFRR